MRSLLLVTSLVHAALATVGVDVSELVDESGWKCLQTPGGQGPIEFSIVRVFRSTGHADETGTETIKAAHAAGIKHVDGYMFPCVTCASSPADQVQAAVAASGEVERLWLDIETFDWPSNPKSNEAFVTGLVDACEQMAPACGIYSSAHNWGSIFGSDSTTYSYPASKGLPLWYAHYDGKPSFSDFVAFGGWSTPTIKQYLGDKTSCGVGLDYNFMPAAGVVEACGWC